MLGVLGLFPLCVGTWSKGLRIPSFAKISSRILDGYKLVEDAFNAKQRLEDEYSLFLLQQGAFVKWGEIWELDSRTFVRRSKLENYLTEGTKIAPRIVHALGRVGTVC